MGLGDFIKSVAPDPIDRLVDAVSGIGSSMKKPGQTQYPRIKGSTVGNVRGQGASNQRRTQAGLFVDPKSDTGWSFANPHGRVIRGTAAPHEWNRVLTTGGSRRGAFVPAGGLSDPASALRRTRMLSGGVPDNYEVVRDLSAVRNWANRAPGSPLGSGFTVHPDDDKNWFEKYVFDPSQKVQGWINPFQPADNAVGMTFDPWRALLWFPGGTLSRVGRPAIAARPTQKLLPAVGQTGKRGRPMGNPPLPPQGPFQASAPQPPIIPGAPTSSTVIGPGAAGAARSGIPRASAGQDILRGQGEAARNSELVEVLKRMFGVQ